VISACPALTTPTLTTTYTQIIPNTAVVANVQIIAGTDYVSAAAAGTACAITYALFTVPASGSPTATTGTWLTIDASTGHVSVDADILGSASYKVTYTRAGVSADSAVF